MHLVSDPEKYQRAVGQMGIPFFHTACGSCEPSAQLTVDPNQVKCPACLALIQQYMASQEPPPPEVPENGGAPPLDFEDEDLSGIDDIDDAFDQEGAPAGVAAPVAAPSPAPSSKATDPLAAFRPMLEALFEDFEIDPKWVRWKVRPEDDPLGSEGMVYGGFDLREILDDDQFDFLSGLARVSEMIGMESLSSRVLTLLHQIVLSGMDEEEHEMEPEAELAPAAAEEPSGGE
jgi:hypothetical protein